MKSDQVCETSESTGLACPAGPNEQPDNQAADETGLNGGRVLDVGDEEVSRRLWTDVLTDDGHEVESVPGGEDAVVHLADHNCDIVITDLMMPGMNGVELASIIRERYPGLPVVLTSGYSNVLAENAHRGFELIQKPYSVESLSRILRKAITEKLSVAR